MKTGLIISIWVIALAILFQVQESAEKEESFRKIETVKMAETSSDPFIQQQAEQIKAEMKLQTVQNKYQSLDQKSFNWDKFKENHNKKLKLLFVIGFTAFLVLLSKIFVKDSIL